MKHLFNNLSEEEKKAILEQHYGKEEIINEQLGQRIKAGIQGAASKIKSVGKATGNVFTGGLNPSPELDANMKKIKSWCEWMNKQLVNFETNITLISKVAENTKKKDLYKIQVSAMVETVKSLTSPEGPLAKLKELNQTIINNNGTISGLPEMELAAKPAPASTTPATQPGTEPSSPEGSDEGAETVVK